MAERNNIWHKILTGLTIIGLALTVVGVVWRTSAQNSKLNTVCIDQQKIVIKIETLEQSNTELKTEMKNLIKQVDSIDRKLARNGKVTKSSELPPNLDIQ